ncbi:MAG: phytoene/squalene synthetase [halophilic archaeon J07HX5]|nr:MAG: phytoene/squalene synthetase [halophilic archaeon J07HX5]
MTVESFREAVDPWLPPDEEWSDDWRVVAAAPTVHATVASLSAETQAAVRPPVRELVQGMATFIDRYAGAGGIRVQSRDELEEYCHYAAGTVGGLITRLLTPEATTEQATTMSQTAESFGRLLQLVNVAKDVYDDYTAENNVYLPAEWLTAEGVTQESVLAAGNRTGAARVVERTAALARSYLDDAGTYLSAMPLGRGNTLAAWAVPYLLAVGTLREIETSPATALTNERIAVSRDEVFAVVRAVQRGERSDIPKLRANIARGPLQSDLTN